MANVIVNDTNLSNIANAIREKNGSSDSYKPSEMATAILAIEGGGGGYQPTEEDLTYWISGSNSPFTGATNTWIIREFGNQSVITFKSPSQNTGSLFSDFPEEYFDATIVFNDSAAYMPVKAMFTGATSLKEIHGTIRFPNNYNSYARIDTAENMFSECNMLRSIQDDFIDADFCHWFNRTGSTYNRMYSSFYNCYSLREIPAFYFKMLGTNTNGEQPGVYSANYGYTNMFQNCHALNKIENLFVISGLTNGNTVSSNMFSNTFTNCHNIHKLTFQTNADGTPLTAAWTNQTIDLTQYFSYASADTNMTGYNSGLTSSGKLYLSTTTPSTQSYKNNGLTTKWCVQPDMAKYGHDQAVETINSLPDTSAAGGGNTIKFNDTLGWHSRYLRGLTSNTEYNSSINKLTADEIAVATAKGWTVTLV